MFIRPLCTLCITLKKINNSRNNLIMGQVNYYLVRSYRDVIVVTNIVTR